MKKLITCGCGILIIVLIMYISSFSNDQVKAGNETEDYEYEYYYNESNSGDNSMVNGSISSKSDVNVKPATKDLDNKVSLPDEIDTDSDSITVFVNKEYSLPSTFIPKNLVIPNIKFFTNGPQEKRYMRDISAAELEKMFSDANDAGETLYGVSGYRSYTRQTTIYNNNVRRRGSAATNQVSAVPGHSEHQTGLAIDISCKDLNGDLSTRFADTSEGKWVAENCYLYGFIIRYPKGCEDITGYTYEPWHIRYVGKDIAKYIYEHKITFEEYFNYTPDSTMINQIISDAATAEKVTANDNDDEPNSTNEPEKDKASSNKKSDTAKNKQQNKNKNKNKNNNNKENNTINNTNNVNVSTPVPVPDTPPTSVPAAPTNEPAVDIPASETETPSAETSTQPDTSSPNTASPDAVIQ